MKETPRCLPRRVETMIRALCLDEAEAVIPAMVINGRACASLRACDLWMACDGIHRAFGPGQGGTGRTS